jgi:hypothetical protein
VIGHCSNISKLYRMEQRLYNIRIGLMLFSIITSSKSKMWCQVSKIRSFLSVTVFGCVSYELNRKVDKEIGGMRNTLKITQLGIFFGASIELHWHCYTHTNVMTIESLRLTCQKGRQKKVCTYIHTYVCMHLCTAHHFHNLYCHHFTWSPSHMSILFTTHL